MEHQTTVFTSGTFEFMHYGHLNIMHRANFFGDRLVVGINSDKSFERYKGRKPCIPIWDRFHNIVALKCVSVVYIFEEDTPLELVSRLRPDVIVKGHDWEGKDIPERKYCGRVEILPRSEGISSSEILEKIKIEILGLGGSNVS